MGESIKGRATEDKIYISEELDTIFAEIQSLEALVKFMQAL